MFLHKDSPTNAIGLHFKGESEAAVNGVAGRNVIQKFLRKDW